LDQIETDPDELYERSLWAILGEDFKWSFIDYAQQKKAHDNLQKLKMTGGNINEYISEFQMLGHQVHMDLDDLAALQFFARGLSNSLANACIDLDGPESFKQWRNSAQRQHRAWLKKQALHCDYNRPPAPKPQAPSQGHWQGLWNNNRERGTQPSHPQLPKRDPNAMDTLAGKATTEEQKAAAMNARGKAIWHTTAPQRRLRLAAQTSKKPNRRLLKNSLLGWWKIWSHVPPSSLKKKGPPLFKASRMMKKWLMTWVF
jgi:hypothetical protein